MSLSRQLLDGGYAPLRREYEKLAHRYDRRWASYLDASIEETLRHLDVRAGERVLDVGCGTGALLARLGEVNRTGVDTTPSMLEAARKRLGPSVRLECAVAEDLPFADGSFDVVLSTSVLHFVLDPLKALGEMNRVLRPGGRIVLTDWCADFPSTRLMDRLLRLFSRAHVRAYRAAEILRMLENAGFVSLHADRYKISPVWGLMTVAGSK